MRRIEEQMVDAVENKNNWVKDNTSVHYIPDCDYSDIYLHGHMIATKYHYGKESIEVNVSVLQDWPTVTTKSRLRALGVNVTTKAGVTYLDGKAID